MRDRMSRASKGAVLIMALAGLIAARPIDLAITATNIVYGGYTTITVVPDPKHDDHIRITCYIPDINGQLVYATWAVVTGPELTVGPLPPAEYAHLWKKPWLPGPGECLAEQGYRLRNGEFKTLISTTFLVELTSD